MRGRGSVSVDQRVVDLVVRPNSFPTTTSIAGRTQVNPSSLIGNAINIVFDGQSTNSNGVSGGGFTLVNTNKVYNGSTTYHASIWRAVDSSGILDADITEGHSGMDLADAIVTAGYAPNVVLWNISRGASTIAQHASATDLLPLIGLVARSICAAGLDGNRTIYDWEHGPTDTDLATSQAAYTAGLNTVITEAKRVGLLRTGNVMFVHPCTRIAGLSGSRNAIKAAQAAVCDAGLVRAGFDVDTITGVGNRPDGTHCNRAGSALVEAGKLPFYQNFLANG